MVTKVMCVTKDEHDLIEPFILFYGTIFGYNNIVIIDNGSTDQRVLDVYKKYPLIDITVDPFPFTEVTDKMTSYILSHKGKCDWMLLMETDEFLYWEGDDVIDEEKVRNYIETLPCQSRFGKVYSSVVSPDAEFICPPMEITKFSKPVEDKVIIKMSTFERMDLWPHHTVPPETENITERLCLLHFHNTGQKRHIERTLSLLKGYGYINGTEPIEEQIQRCRDCISLQLYGKHRLQYYLDHLTGIVPSQESTPFIEITQLSRWFNIELKIKTP